MIKNKKNILILGGLGFIGKNLIEEFLLDVNYNIIVFNFKNQPLDNKWLNKNVKLYYGDFTLVTDLEKIFKENKIDIIFHLISTTIPSSSNNIIADINHNLGGTIKLLDLMRNYDIKKIIFFSSGGTIYGLPNGSFPDRFSEDYQNNPICSHGIVKLTIEKYLYLYKHFYSIDYLILRLANPFGEYHFSSVQGLINVTLKNIANNEPTTIWGSGEVIRDYIYVKDCVRVIKNLIDKNIYNDIINIGSGLGYSVNEVLNMIKKITGDFKINRLESRKFDVPKIVLDVSKIKSIINFKPTDIKIGIEKTYNWILKNSYE
ncbi:MAG: NAD-dependent epimerase/dehydratase family protein [Patescibacteria group bacterium]